MNNENFANIKKQFEKINEEYFEKLPNNVSMKTAVWGPPTWFFLHSMAMAYPKKIDENDEEHNDIRKSMHAFLLNLGNVLPCSLCGNSYNQYIREPDLNIWNYLDSRSNLVLFIYLIHEKVNNKLGVPKCDRPSPKEVVKFYNKFRAGGCSATTEEARAQSLLLGCDDKEMKKGTFKKYKCIVNVVDENKNKMESIKENFTGNTGNTGKSSINIFLVILVFVLLIIIGYLLYDKYFKK